jgi:hypothetical protein
LSPPSAPFWETVRSENHADVTASNHFPWASRSSAATADNRRNGWRCARAVTPPSEFDQRMPPRLMLEPRGSSLSFRPLQRSQHGEVTVQMHEAPACAGPSTARLRRRPGSLTPSTTRLLPEPGRLVSSDSRSWGSTLQSFSPRRQPERLSTPCSVLTSAPYPPACPSRPGAMAHGTLRTRHPIRCPPSRLCSAAEAAS